LRNYGGFTWWYNSSVERAAANKGKVLYESPSSDVDLAAWGIPDDQYYRTVAAVPDMSPDFEVDLVDPERYRGLKFERATFKVGTPNPYGRCILSVKIYLDTSVYDRPFDDQTQPRIWLATLSFAAIMQMIEAES
jgi:hypothetical protein